MSIEHGVIVYTEGPTTSWRCVECPAKGEGFHVPAAAEDAADQHRCASAADPKDAA